MSSQRMHRFVSPDGTRYMTGRDFCARVHNRDPRGSDLIGDTPRWKIARVLAQIENRRALTGASH